MARKIGRIEQRLMDGEVVMKTYSDLAAHGVFYQFVEDGRTARADIVERLIKAGTMKPLGDGLFPEESQTWAVR